MQSNKPLYVVLSEFYETSTEESFQVFYLELYQLALHTAFYITKNHADAEDIAQQSFLIVFKKINVCQSLEEKLDSKIKSWFLGIVYNQSKMHLRQKSRSKHREKESSINHPQEDQEAQLMNQDENTKKHKALQSAIENLSEMYRVPIILKYKEGLENQNIAEILQLNQSTLRNRLSRGIAQLKTVLFKNEHEIEEILPTIALLPLFGLSNQIQPPLFNPKTPVKMLAQKSGFLNQSFFYASTILASATLITLVCYFYYYSPLQKPETSLVNHPTKGEDFKFTYDYSQGALHNTEAKLGNWKFSDGYRIPEPEKDIYIQFNDTNIKAPCRLQVVGGTVVQNGKYKFEYAVQGTYYSKEGPIIYNEMYFKKRDKKSSIDNAKILNKDLLIKDETATIIFIDDYIVTEYKGKICKIIQTNEDLKNFNKFGLIINSFGIKEVDFESLSNKEISNYRHIINDLIKQPPVNEEKKK